jgi:hypothetical protein
MSMREAEMTEKGDNASSPDLQIRLPLIARQRLP